MRNRSILKIPFKTKCRLCLLPSAVGLFLFYLIPLFRVIYYSVLNNTFQKRFVWFDNYINLINNEYYRLALKNTFIMILTCVPMYILISFLLSVLMAGLKKKGRYFRGIFVLPIVLPTSGIVFIMRIFLLNAGSPYPIYLLYMWKYIGYAIILFTAAISLIPEEIYEAAKLDGANIRQLHAKITIPFVKQTALFSALLGIVFCFRVYRESRMFYVTDYPPDFSYTLQYYMNNHFRKLNYQNLAASSIITTLIILLAVFAFLALQKKLEKKFYS